MMNVDAAIQDSIKFARTADAGFDKEKMQQAACILAGEVEYLRDKLEDLQMQLKVRDSAVACVCAEIKQLQKRLEYEEVKSIPPCGIEELTQEGQFKIEFYCENKKATARMMAWLRERDKAFWDEKIKNTQKFINDVVENSQGKINEQEKTT